MPSLRVIGPGRAGGSLQRALSEVGWEIALPVGRDESVTGAAVGVDLLVISTPDSAVAEVSAKVEPVANTVVAHLAGSLGLDVLGTHERRAALHPLVSLPTVDAGARRLRAGAWFAVAGDGLVDQVVRDLGGRSFEVPDGNRAMYHAAACVASNHLVALLGQVERMATRVGVPFEAYLSLVTGTLENVGELGVRAALTGPAARGDELTLRRHRDAILDASLAPEDLSAYEAMVALARCLTSE